MTTSDLGLVGKINDEIFKIHQWMPSNVQADIKLQLVPSNSILRKLVVNAPDPTASVTSAILHVREQQAMSSVALEIEKLRASGNNIKLFVPHTITNQQHIATGARTYTDSSFINGEILPKLALAFVKSTSAIRLCTRSQHKIKIFSLSSLVCKSNGIRLYNLSFDTFYRILFGLTMHSLGWDLQLFENGTTDTIFAKTHGIILLELSGTQDIIIV